MDLSLSVQEQAFEAEVRQFIQRTVTPTFREAQRRACGFFVEPEIARQWQAVLFERGWAAPAWPREHGGPGWTVMQRFIFERVCAEYCAPFMQGIGVRMIGPIIIRYGSDDQRARFLPRILRGDDYWCQGYSEPQAGSDLAAIRTTASDDGDHYIINGTKIWTTYAHFADWMFALVRTSRTGREQDGITFVVFPMNTLGISTRPIITLAGDHEVNQVFLDNVRIPKVNRIGEEGKGWTYGKVLLEFERGGSILGPRLRSLLSLTLEQADARAQGALSQPLRERIARVEMDIDTFEFMELRLLSEAQAGKSPGPLSSLIRFRAAQIRQAIFQLGLDIWGSEANGPDSAGRYVTTDHPAQAAIARYLNGRAYTIVGGTAEIQHDIMAKQWLRL